MTMNTENQQFGFVTLCGLPNAGKSTLLNKVLKQKVAAVSPKAQTTRFNTIGVIERGPAQIVFTDTPGLLQPRHSIDRILRKNAFSALRTSDVVVFIIDVSAKNMEKVHESLQNILKQYKDLARIFVAFNKTDQVSSNTLVERASPFQQYNDVHDFFMISAIHGSGVSALLDSIAEALPHQPWMYPPHTNPTADLQRWASELTMEQIFLHINNEVPYQTYVAPVHFEEDENGLHFFQNIVVAKASQKAILIGKKGSTLKTIGQAARLNIAHALKRRVHLQLLVKIFSDWVQSKRGLYESGLVEE